MEVISGFWLPARFMPQPNLASPTISATTRGPSKDIARDTSTNASALYRLMRALATWPPPASSRSTRGAASRRRRFRKACVPAFRGRCVPAPSPNSEKTITQPGRAWADSVRTGEIAFDKRFGMPVWQYYQQNPEQDRIFEQSMSGVTERINEAIVSSYLFGGFRRILDIGGGEGTLLQQVLKSNPEAEAMVFDRPEVIEMARHRSAAIRDLL